MESVRILIDGPSELQFDYSIPETLKGRVSLGSRVEIPLRNRKATGTVVGEGMADDNLDVLKPVEGLIEEEPVVTPALLKLAEWMASYYCAPLESVMRSILPEAVRLNEHGFKTAKVVRLVKTPETKEWNALHKRAPKQSEVIARLIKEKKEVLLSELSHPAAKALEKKGFVEIADQKVERDPFKNDQFLASHPLVLNPEQEVVLATVLERLDAPDGGKPMLLKGVTGSGKTEVFLQAIQAVLDRGKTAIVLVPEISLTPQTVGRFKSRFATMQDEIAVLHSHLSEGERFDEWHKIQGKKARIVIGARSALFAPLRNVGLIVVDEEHEPSYKQDKEPRYNARDLAVVRGKMENAAVLLGSATPSLESHYNTLKKKYDLLTMYQRADAQKLPIIRVIDMRLESRKQKAGPSVISEKLRGLIDQRLADRQQIILFLNRRGFASSLQCLPCGHVCECPHCSVSLTFHRKEGVLMCHICGHDAKAPKRCPKCRDPGIRFAGYGTEKVEEVLRKVFKTARIARVDTDSMSRKNQLKDTLNAFKARKLDMLIGTQMIAKGLHFPNVTLVGIINADLGLHIPDFRAGERTFSLLTQVAGRAGRGEMEGEVVIQTYTPHHPSIQFARHHDFDGYCEQELQLRMQFNYPPFTHVVLLTVRSSRENLAQFTLENLCKRIRKELPEGIKMGEPMPSPLAKAAGQYRFQVMMRSRHTSTMTKHIRSVMGAMTFPKEVIVMVDVDPLSLS